MVIPLCDIVSSRLSIKSLGKMSWSENIFCTRNFIETVLNDKYQKDSTLDKFLRVVDIMIHFPSGEYLLVSEREANHLLVEFWKRKECNFIPKGMMLCHYSFECKEGRNFPPLTSHWWK